VGRHWSKCYGKKTNINSTHQLAYILYDKRKIKLAKKTPSGKGAVDDEALGMLNIPELNTLLSIRKLTKVKSTYLMPFIREQVNGVVHPSFNLHLARSFRSSSDKPNFQNIPKHDEESMRICRGAIKPRPGHQIIEFDYKGIEVSTSVCYHKDPRMKKYVEDPRTDMHRDMATQIFCTVPNNILRQAAKNGFVFPQFYGDYYVGCTHNLACTWGKLPKSKWRSGQGIEVKDIHLSDILIEQGIKSYDEFEQHIKTIESDFWKKRFKVYDRWKERWWAEYQKRGYIEMLTGFKCVDIIDRKQACNRPIQGSAFHCLLWSFIEIDRIQQEEQWNSRLIGQVHDSLVMDVHPDELEYVIGTVKRVTCEELPKAWDWIIVPLSVDMEICQVDAPWSEKEEYHGT